jgi:preprotein translocase subunit YajC
VPLLLLTIPFAVVLWFVMVRPQQERMKAHQRLVAELAVGDRVISAGGIHGEILAVTDDTVDLLVAEGVVLTMARPAFARRIEDPAETADVESVESIERGRDNDVDGDDAADRSASGQGGPSGEDEG